MKTFSILSSGIDRLFLSMDVRWKNGDFLAQLRESISFCKSNEIECPFYLHAGEGVEPLAFALKPHGSRGYPFLLVGADYALKVMDWLEPKAHRPSVLIEFRSEVLWRAGPNKAVQRLLYALKANGAEILAVKPSRVDLCLDAMCPSKGWDRRLIKHLVTQATDRALYFTESGATGLSIGKKQISARIYDKVCEIEKSKKTWFFDVWSLSEIPEGKSVLRFEFQVRREPLRECGLGELDQLFAGVQHLWAYLTRKWLKFQSNPGKHHTQRNTLPWWEKVQEGFMGIQDGEPLIRAKAVSNDARRLERLVSGAGSSLVALELGEAGLPLPDDFDRSELAATVRHIVNTGDKVGQDLRDEIARKRAKRSRMKTKLEQAIAQRQRLGLLGGEE